MYYDLLKIDKEMDMTKYSLKDLALYFEKFDGYICEIKTDNRILKFMFDINSFPHLIGLHHAFKGKKNRNEYKGAVGFEKIKNGEITYNDIMKRAKELDLVDINQIVAVTENFDGKNLVDYSKFENTKFLSDDGKGVLSETTMYRAILEAKKYDKIIMIHAESELSPIDYRIAEDLMTLRDVYLAKRLDGRIHLCHVSTIDSLEAVRRGKKEGVKVTCEVTPHHIALWDNSYRVNPPIREKSDVEALIDGIVDGTVDAIATDHAPHTAEDKANGSPGLVGLETAFAICNTKLVKERNIDIRTLSKVMSYGGANLMGIKKGLLKEGYFADLVIVDTDKKIVVDSSKFASKAKNTPFDKMELYGEVLMTIKAGEIKYKGEF